MAQQAKLGLTKLFGNFLIFFLMLLIVMPSTIGPDATEGTNTGDSTGTRQGGLPKIFAEYFTTGGCELCPSASRFLKGIFDDNTDSYDFYFVSMILEDSEGNLISQDANDRADVFGISEYPTVEFEGGYIEVEGGQDDDTAYRDALQPCANREAADIDITLFASHISEAKIDISASIANNEATEYSGTLRVYIAEIESRYLNYDGAASTFGFLDFAIETDISVSPGGSATETTSWNGADVIDGLGNSFADIEAENIIIFATVFNSQRAMAIDRHQDSSLAINLYFIDEAAATYLIGGSPDDTEPPSVEIVRPESNEELGGNIRIDAEITDNGIVSNVDYMIDSTEIWTRMYPVGPGDDEYFAFFDTRVVEDGTHTITVRAIDSANNQQTDSVDIIIANYANDNTRPTIEFSDLSDNQKIAGNPSFNVRVTDDSDLKRVEFRIDDSNWQDMDERGYNTYRATINTFEYPDGKHTLTVKAEDMAGNIHTEAISIEIINNPSKKSNNDSTPGFEAVILIAGIIVTIIYFFSTSKKK
jgi:hypothetical protein